MRTWLILAGALWACSPPPEPAAINAAPGGACAARAGTSWTAGGGVTFTVEAESAGDACATAAVTLTIRSRDGATAYEQHYLADQVMTLAGADSVDDLRRRLSEWITPPGAQMDSTGDLPAWTEAASFPMNEEFPFYPEDGVTREIYEALRGEDRAMFCYVQGMESMACLAMHEGALTKIGVQSFPG
jgi:hypothetical protein